MRLRHALLVLAALAAPGSGRADEAHPLLASAPVDASVFRDGEVQRSAKPFQSWVLVCDTIARLGHKFCSLHSTSVRLGSDAVQLLVSTGDDGRPAALIRLPFGLSLPFGLLVEPLGTAHAPGRHVPIALCGAGGCEAVWTLSPAEIAALRTGGGLRVAVRGGRTDVGKHAMPEPISATIPKAGFTDAVTASLQ